MLASIILAPRSPRSPARQKAIKGRLRLKQGSKATAAAALLSRRLLASLEHPNVIALYEAFVDHAPRHGAQLFIVTALVPKGDLASLLE